MRSANIDKTTSMAAPGWVICLVLVVILVQDRTSADSGSLNSCGKFTRCTILIKSGKNAIFMLE